MVWGLQWLLALLVLIASVDRLPDPPAARPDYTQFRISASHEQPVAVAAEWPLPSATQEPIFQRGESLLPSPIRRISPTFAMRRATDSSPPGARRHFSSQVI